MMKEDILSLRTKINSIVVRDRSEGKIVLTKIEREIINIENDLNEQHFHTPSRINIGILQGNPELPFGPSGFKCRDYALIWDVFRGNQFSFFLENETHHNKRRLVLCSDEFKKISVVLLSAFVAYCQESVTAIIEPQ